MKSSAATFARARQLRWTMTEPERLLWAMLRGKQTTLRFRRQQPVGSYVLDFYCPAIRLAVEVDGPVHDEPEQIKRDASRNAWLQAQGIRILRFPASEIHERPGTVLAAIAQAATPSVASGDTSPTALP